MVQRYSKTGCGVLVTYGKCHSHPTQSTDLVITHLPVVQTLCWISLVLGALLQVAEGWHRSHFMCSGYFGRNLPTTYPGQICMTRWYRISLVLSLCLNKCQGLKYFAKLEPDPGLSWTPSGHTKHGIRTFLPPNASQSSICKTCRLEQKSLYDIPILSQRNSLDMTTATDNMNFYHG